MQDDIRNIHFIAIGGSIMHDLAITLHKKGMKISGSDDQIFEPSKSRLDQYNLLPEQTGWFPEKITKELDAVILGMHAKEDNPELLKAQEIGLKIYSFPEFIYEQSKNKQRVVIAGSHGKTTITAIILHVLKYFNREFDYLIGARLEGFEDMVKLTQNAPLIVIEGDEYFTSPLDHTPKFLKYHHHIGLINGLAWDHANVYSDFNSYTKQFDSFADATPKAGTLAYFEDDDLVDIIGKKERTDVQSIPYHEHPHKKVNEKTVLITKDQDVSVNLFGKHNMQNISAAKTILLEIGLTEEMFYQAIGSFKGASRRLEIIDSSHNFTILRDYAHAPSKVEATTMAVKHQFPKRKLLAFLELHTYSSLSRDFISQYDGTLDSADLPIIYFDPEAVALKKFKPLTLKEIKEAFGREDILLFTEKDALEAFILKQDVSEKSLLFMSSGNFGGLDISGIGKKIVAQ
ncbi:UDP-N-acetylmuramate--L-alanine ligase [Xanthovirga aplysinae]|uniref:UDP-N-acetylmuramate--L-alanine ligase n=1 Tax=Xanthovirga aplysinae TaxID=2529853 RepID=UPI0012BD098B|nr:Mur ligase family protein [Xanthovirga aplysinae]MTI32121.1 peptidoglycan synthetase [Xanthovirga aplysinae]